jgi:hypothetical protein
MSASATRPLAAAIGAVLAALSASAQAVVLNPRGSGQVLIYPYYTVNHQPTLISVLNDGEEGKAIRVRFREGYDGREVAGFNVYLGAFDSWVGAVFDTSGDGSGAAAVATSDNSCTVPAFDATVFPQGPRVLVFSDGNYTGGDYGSPDGNDSGPTGLARTREGFVEVIEMGRIGYNATGQAIAPDASGMPADCARVVDAWSPGGYWTQDPTVDLGPPDGGLYGAAGIVDVAQGTLYAYDATAIDGFSDVIQHTAPGDPKPNLSTAVTDSANDIATAWVPVGNAMLRADYPASSRGVDAVSAVLMVDALYNEFDVEPGVGAATDWVVTFPTKQFYVDPGIVGTGSTDHLPPFESIFDVDSCATVDPQFVDRDGSNPAPATLCYPEPLGVIGASNYLCYEMQGIGIGSDDMPSAALGSTITHGLYPLSCRVEVKPLPTDSGNVILQFDNPDLTLRPSLEGYQFLGLPALGFAAINYINANVTPGVLSNYSGTYPHRAHAACVRQAGGPCD